MKNNSIIQIFQPPSLVFILKEREKRQQRKCQQKKSELILINESEDFLTLLRWQL